MSNELIVDYSLEDKCRICLQPSSDLGSFFDIYFEDLSLAQVFKNITSYEIVEDDRLPKKVCVPCKTIIINFNNMISVFQDTESILKKTFSKEEDLDETNLLSNYNNENYILNESDNDNENYLQEDDNGEYCEESFEQEGEEEEDVKDVKEYVPVEKSKSNNSSSNLEYNVVNSVKYTCECGDCFLYKLGFRYHMQHRHNKIIDDSDLPKYTEKIKLSIPIGFPNNVEFVTPKTVVKRSKLECRVCSTTFASEEEVKAHEEVHKTHVCDQCGAAFFKKGYLQDHQLKHSEDRRYKCKICSKAFKHRHTLSVHKRIHEDTKSFVCEICGSGFKQRTTLVTHTLLKHSDVKNFPCPACHLRFNLKSTRDKHYIRKHTFNREKSFVCSKCGAAYLNKTTLTRHMADKHLGKAKYYPCTICENKMYVLKKGLMTHMIKKHGIFE